MIRGNVLNDLLIMSPSTINIFNDNVQTPLSTTPNLRATSLGMVEDIGTQ